ncbi:MAG: helix-turn-helix transcriptional regulator [Jatrophihabitantaceae bacterium]
MTTSPSHTDPETQVLGQTRSRVWALVQGAAGPLGVTDVADQIGLHPNTARFHLDALVEAGLAERAVEDRELPGRPRTLYTARSDAAPTGPRSYRLLAEILTGLLASQSSDPAKAALEAGDAWGRYLANRPAPFERVDSASATRQLVSALDDIGFAPEAVTAGRKRRILLHQCPFREVAESHSEVICSIHLGLMQGLLGELDAPLQAERLDPFVEPSLCVAHLATKPASGRAARLPR